MMKRIFAAGLLLALQWAGMAAGVMYTNLPQTMTAKTVGDGLKFSELAVPPATPAANEFSLFGLETNGLTEPYIRKSDGTVRRLSDSAAAGNADEVQFRDSTNGQFSADPKIQVRAGSLDIRTNMISKAIEGFTGGFGTVVAGGSQWERRGIAVVGGAADSYYVCEPSLIYAPNPQILTGVTSNVYKLWFSVGGYTIPSIGYAESQDGVSYTRRAGRLTTLDGYQRGQVVWTGTDYWFWGVRFPNSLAFDRFVSTDGITWSAAQTDVYTVTTTNTFTPALGNISVLYHTNAPAWLTNSTVWICTFDVCTNIAAPSLVPPNQWIDYCMVSQDGINWSPPWRLAGPALSSFTGDASMQDLSLHPGTGAAFLGGTPGPPGTWIYGIGHFTYPGGIFLPSELVKIATHDLTNWWFTDQYFTLTPELNRMTEDEGAFSGYGQLADPSVAQGYDLAGNIQTVMVYDAIEDQVAASGSFKLKVAVSSKSLDDTLNFRGNGQLQVPGLATFWSNVEIGNPKGVYDVNFAAPEVLVTGYQPVLSLNSLYAQPDEGQWMLSSLAGTFALYAVPDNYSAHIPVLWFTRTSTNVQIANLRSPRVDLYDVPGNSNQGLRFNDNYGSGANQWELMSSDSGSGANVIGFFRLYNWTHGNDTMFVNTNGDVGIGPQAGAITSRLTIWAKTNQTGSLRIITTNATHHPIIRDAMSLNGTWAIPLSMTKGQTSLVENVYGWLAGSGGWFTNSQDKVIYDGDTDASRKSYREFSINTGNDTVPAMRLDGYAGVVGVALPLQTSNTFRMLSSLVIPAGPTNGLYTIPVIGSSVTTNWYEWSTNVTWTTTPVDGQSWSHLAGNKAATNIVLTFPDSWNGRAHITSVKIAPNETTFLSWYHLATSPTATNYLSMPLGGIDVLVAGPLIMPSVDATSTELNVSGPVITDMYPTNDDFNFTFSGSLADGQVIAVRGTNGNPSTAITIGIPWSLTDTGAVTSVAVAAGNTYSISWEQRNGVPWLRDSPQIDLTSALAAKAPIASPVFTGRVQGGDGIGVGVDPNGMKIGIVDSDSAHTIWMNSQAAQTQPLNFAFVASRPAYAALADGDVLGTLNFTGMGSDWATHARIIASHSGGTGTNGVLSLLAGDVIAMTAPANDNDTSVASTAFVTGSTVSFTGKTFDSAATGNVLKQTKHLFLMRPDYGDGVGAVPQTNSYVASGLMHYTFTGGTAETNANWVVYETVVPADLDVAVAMTATIGFVSGGTDADTVTFHLTYALGAAGTAMPSLKTGIALLPIVMTTTPTTPASGDVQVSAATTLTGWAAAMTAGTPLFICVAKLNDSNDDTQREMFLDIAYGSTQ